jgi:hypothetical protein
VNRDYSVGLEAGARGIVLILGLLSSLGLFLIREGIKADWPAFHSPALLTALYTLLIAVPVVYALLLEQVHDRLPPLVAAIAIVVLMPLAVHTGRAVMPELKNSNGTIYFHYGVAVSLACFIAVPYLQATRRAPTVLHYPALYEYAWGNALTLAIAAVFTSASWLILFLWQALFALIGIKFFTDLFSQPAFGYPATGVFVSIGLMLGRTQAGTVRTLLNICLTLGRGLFPLVAVASLLFLAALAFNHLEPLWHTRHASSLLLTLVLAAVALFNAVYQDGEPAQTYPRPLQWLSAACLAVLPIFVGIAAYGLGLRVRQHGWTEERLWGTLITVFAGLYALGYAISALRTRSGLPAVDKVNSLIALALITALILTQSPILDFRRVAVQSQVAHAFAPGGDPSKLDLHYLRFDAGRAGNDVLRALRSDPRVAGNAPFVASVDDMLQRTNSYNPEESHRPITASVFTVVPTGATVPDGLVQALGKAAPAIGSCAAHPGECLLMQTDLANSGAPIWIVVTAPNLWYMPIYVQDASGWQMKGLLQSDGKKSDDLRALLRNGKFSTQPSAWKNLVLSDGTRFYVVERTAP